MAICQTCRAHRSKLFRCVTCGKKLCGCCSFRSREGRVCSGGGACHKVALAHADEIIDKSDDMIEKAYPVKGGA
jgi:hypothetical protein